MEKKEIKQENNNPSKNSSFDNLLKLQTTLQEEVALRDIFFEDRDSLLKKIESNCLEYYKTRISIQELYDNNSQSDPNKKKIKYIFCEKPQSEIPQYYEIVKKIIYYYHDNNELTLKLIEKCPKESYPSLANFICNYFYVNIFSSSFLNENLLTLIYLFLVKEVDKIILKDENSDNISKPFLDFSNSFIPYLLRCLVLKDDIKTYLENVLKKSLARVAGLLNNQKDNLFLGFDFKKMLAFLNGQNYQIRNTNKTFKSYLNLLTMEIKKSKLSILKKKNKENDDTIYSSYLNKLGLDDKPNSENNFYSITTRDTFDNLLIENNPELNEEENNDDLSEDDEELAPIKDDLISGNLNNNNIKDDFEYFLINSGFYSGINNSFIDKKRESVRFDIFNDLYTKELNKETLLDLIDNEDDREMEEYLLKQLNIIQENEKSNVFTNTKLINEIIHSGINTEELEQVILIYKYHFESIKIFLDELFTSLILNQENVPYMLRAICTIITKLLSIKFKNASSIIRIRILNEFFFNGLIIPILENPQMNGILMYDYNKDKNRNLKIKTAIKILQKFINCELYNSTKSDEYFFTIFNPYFIEIMPFMIEFYRELSSSKLPINIEKLLINKKENKQDNSNIKYDYLKMHPEERLEHQSICITYKDILTLYEVIKNNENELLIDNTNIMAKYLKKLKFHEKDLKEKVQKDEENSKKTFIYFSELISDDDLKKLLNLKKEQNLSFQTDENLAETDYALSILTKIKFCINTIMKHLNILSKSNFYSNETDSTKDFVKDLNKMIHMEGFSEILKEKKLPLEWYGLYLQSNIENIPQNYKENNYALLYNELIEESKKNLLKIQNDDSLNILYSKIINSEKMIDIGLNNLKRTVNNKIKYDAIEFIKNSNNPVILDIGKQNEQITYIGIREDTHIKGKNETNDKNIISIKCKNIIEFCNNFPDIDSDDVFVLEEEIELVKNLNEYFEIIYKNIEKDPIFTDYSVEEKQNVEKQIENFIYVQLYEKLYCKTSIKADNDVYTNSVRLSWVKPQMLDKSLSQLDEKMVQLIISFINNMNEEKSPSNKLREFENIYFIINNIITLYGYNKDTFINILAYILIKCKQTKLYSTLRYIQIFLNDDIREEKTYLLDKFRDVISKITSFSEKDVNLTKEEYENNCLRITQE